MRPRSLGLKPILTICAPSPASEVFHTGRVATNVLAGLSFAPRTIDVLAPGAQSSLQELPGRLHLWHVGVPPTGPMDERSFRLANTIVGNAQVTAALELTVTGPTLRFNVDAVIGLAGARMAAKLDGVDGRYTTCRSRSAPARCWRSAASRARASAAISLCAAASTRRKFSARAPCSLSAASAAMPPGALKAGDVLHIGKDGR